MQVLLFVLNQQFQDDTETLVIAPITKMVTIIKQLAMDPLKKPEQVQSLEEAEALMREMKGKKRKKKKKKPGPELETAVLENTILRIGDLIQVGFGTCGKDVIGNNMSCGDGELAIMTPGQIVDAVLGYVDLRGFQDITVCLQEHVRQGALTAAKAGVQISCILLFLSALDTSMSSILFLCESFFYWSAYS